jgi:hypothetical protein
MQIIVMASEDTQNLCLAQVAFIQSRPSRRIDPVTLDMVDRYIPANTDYYRIITHQNNSPVNLSAIPRLPALRSAL